MAEALTREPLVPTTPSPFDATRWYAVAEPLIAGAASPELAWGAPRTLAQLDTSTLADLIKAAADELAGRGYWTRKGARS